eukprot:gene37156-45098_t
MVRSRSLEKAARLASSSVKASCESMPTSIPTSPLPLSSALKKASTVVVNEEKLASKSLSRVVEKQTAGDASYVIGMDEAGRGPLAGPVVCAACFIPFDADNIPGIADSKLLTEPEREFLFEKLTTHPQVKYATSVVSHTEIDEINILQASLQGMARATNSLLAQLSLTQNSPSVVGLVDGNKMPPLTIPAKTVVQGDRKIYSIAAASIIAKVTRDRIMVDLDRQYPQYELALHKGYPTPRHFALLSQWGASDIHRRSYAPVRKAIENWDRRLGKAAQDEGGAGKSKPGAREDAEEVVGGRGKRVRKSVTPAESNAVSTPAAKKARKTANDAVTKSRTPKDQSSSIESVSKVSRNESVVTKKRSVAVSGGDKPSQPAVTVRRSPRLAKKPEV